MESQPNTSLTSELIGDKSQIRKLFYTYKQSWTNIKAVVDDYYEGKNSYTGPFKYAISIIAPYVIILNIINYDVAGLFLKEFQPAIDTDPNINPEVAQATAAFLERFNEVNAFWINLQIVEFLPLYYAVIFAPVFAFILSKFFKKENVTLRYYYAFTIYVVMTICTVTFFINFVGIYLNYSLIQLSIIGSIIFAVVLAYSSYKVFNQTLFKSTIKILFVFVICQIIIVIPTTIILMTITILTL